MTAGDILVMFVENSDLNTYNNNCEDHYIATYILSYVHIFCNELPMRDDVAT